MNWIDVKDKNPDKDGRYIVAEDNNLNWVGVCQFRKGKWDFKITHWMELPINPEKIK